MYAFKWPKTSRNKFTVFKDLKSEKRANLFIYELALTQSLKVHSKSWKCRILFAAKTDLDGITHEQTIICRQLFAGHVVGSQPMKMGEKIHRMIKRITGSPIYNCQGGSQQGLDPSHYDHCSAGELSINSCLLIKNSRIQYGEKIFHITVIVN